MPKTKVCLVGLKKDLRDELAQQDASATVDRSKFVSTEEGRKYAEAIGVQFFECSSLKGENLASTFEAALADFLESSDKDVKCRRQTGFFGRLRRLVGL